MADICKIALYQAPTLVPHQSPLFSVGGHVSSLRVGKLESLCLILLEKVRRTEGSVSMEDQKVHVMV